MSIETLQDAIESQSKAITEGQKATGHQLKEIDARLFDLEQKKGKTFGGGHQVFETAGAQFAKSNQVEAFLKGNATEGRFTLTKALTENVSGDNANNSPVETERRPGAVDKPMRDLSILDVIPTTNIGSYSYDYVQFADFDNKAAVVAEGELKPESSLSFKRANAEAVVIAHHMPVSNQLAADEPALAQFINGKLTNGLRDKLAASIVNGDGTGAITGLKDVARAFTSSQRLAIDKIAAALSELGSAGYRPDVILMAPSDWLALATQKNGAGDYQLAGPQAVASKSLWNTRVVTDSSVAPGTAYLFDSSAITLLVRQAATIAIGNVDDQMVRNMFTVLCEGRYGLAFLNTEPVLSIALSDDTSTDDGSDS